MRIYRRISIRSKQRKKFLLILLWFIILPIIINTPLFSTLKKNLNYTNNEEVEKDLINEENIYVSSSNPPNRNYFKYYKQITINYTKVAGTGFHKNFPVLISIFDSELHYVVQSDGDDIAFANDTDWLDHEIELFNQNYNSTHAQLVAWVRVPRLFTSIDTNIFMYYGNYTMENQENPAGVWDSNYMMVQHLKETSGIHYDSTSNNNDGTPLGGVTQDTTGKIDGADYFDGIDDNVDMIDSSSLDPSGDITVEAWVNFNELSSERGSQQKIVMKRHYSAPWVSYELMMYTDDNLIFQWVDTSENYESAGYWRGDIEKGKWYHLVGVRDGNSLLFYLNGVDDYTWTDTVSGSMYDADGELNLGNDGFSNWLNGKIDEVRISNVARSADWVETEFNNQNDPESFYSISSTFQITSPTVKHFNYYKVITIDHTKVSGSEYLVNFPVLISIFDSDLYKHVQPDGDDIAFTNGILWLYHEIELFNKTYNNTHAQLVAWVRIPLLSPYVDTYIMMYYGNSTMEAQENPVGVWDSNYIMVQHLYETSKTTGSYNDHLDSTLNNNDGEANITPESNMDKLGQIGGADEFDGVNDMINYGNSPDFDITASLTIQGWIKFKNTTSCHTIVAKSYHPTGTAYWLLVYDTNKAGFCSNDGGGWVFMTYSSVLTDGMWYYVVGTFDQSLPSDNAKLYINGVEHDSMTWKNPLVSTPSDVHTGQFTGSYANATIDEVRVSNIARSVSWIETEFSNQYDPDSFYSIGAEQIEYRKVQVNTYDLYDNLIPNVNVSMYNRTKLIRSAITNVNGSVTFLNLNQAEYNFTVTITSNITPYYIEIINRTNKAILVDDLFEIINITCNISRNIFSIKDIDGNLVNSGWIIVNNGTDLQNCTIDVTGQAIFRWLNTSGYNYTVWYRDINYNPRNIILASGDIIMPNSQINISVNLTTVNFTVHSYPSAEPISGLKLMISNSTSGDNIVNLITDEKGEATFRWLNSSGFNGYFFNYSLQIRFYGVPWQFNMSGISKGIVYTVNFTIKANAFYNLSMIISLTNYTTKLISLNPTDYISIKWGSILKLRLLFNVTKAGPLTHLIGPTYADTTSFQIYDDSTIVQSGTMFKEEANIGRHQVLIETESLESNKIYFIKLKAQKAGFTIPSDLVFTLFTQNNDLILNQSDNEDSVQSVYWLNSVNMSVKPYGKIIESFTTGTSIFQSIDHNFRFSLPNINSHWNLSQITFNIYNISWNVNASDINLSILDPFGVNRVFNVSNHAGWNYNLGTWTGITINFNKVSPTFDNNFEFFISGTFDNTIDVIADASFIRNGINAQYVKFNVSDTISITSESEGWVIKNITFIIQNCYNVLTWQKVNLSVLTTLNVSIADGYKYCLYSGDENGNGELIIDDRIIYPHDNQYLFIVESNPNIVFDAIITVEYIQYFYQNQYLETLNISFVQQNIPNGGNYQLSLIDSKWDENYAVLVINGINNGSQQFYPSQVAMNITIEGQIYNVSDIFKGTGKLSLIGFNKDTIYSAVIETNRFVNFTLSFTISCSRIVNYEIKGNITYFIREAPDIYGIIQYNQDLGYYIESIDTSLLDADEYTVRFTATKDHYISAIKDLEIEVLSRLTLINGESELYRSIENIYVKDAINFTLLYIDAFTGARISNLKTKYFVWEKYSSNGSVIEQGQGNIICTVDDLYVLDFDTEMRTEGNYLLIVTLDKDNYDYKNAMIFLTMIKREMDYSLSENFKNNQISVVQGKTVLIEIKLTDPTKGDIALTNATVLLIIKGHVYEFEELVNGTYRCIFPTDYISTFFTSETLAGMINITREDYISEGFSITIVVTMEEIFPGMPTFYFLLILFASIISIGGIVAYRVYKYAIIPTFVKKVRGMQKAIKGSKLISESLLYPSKEILVGEIVRDKWDNLELSLGDILGIEIKKHKTLSKIKSTKLARSADLKPIGLLLMRWNERIGTELLVKYPQKVDISDKTLMQLYSTHEYSGERGVITLTVGSMNILSYYTGPESGYYVVLLLNLEDDPDAYEGLMASVAQIILQNVEDDSYLEMVPSLFQRFSVYPNLNNEQNLAFYCQDEIRRMILNILGEYGAIPKSELTIWLKEKYKEDFFDLEAILADFIKKDLIKGISVKGMPSELIFLIKDVFMLRIPPVDLLENPVNRGLPIEFIKMYQKEVREFFEKYIPSEEDNLKIIDILIDPQVYETLRLLRSAIVTMESLEKLKKKGVDDIYSVLKKLWDTHMIKVFKDEDENEYYALISDFYIDLIFPKYLLNVIKESYEQKSKSNKVLLEYLDVLENIYFDLKSKKKKE